MRARALADRLEALSAREGHHAPLRVEGRGPRDQVRRRPGSPRRDPCFVDALDVAMSLWADASRASTAFGGLRKGIVHLEAVERVKDATRSRFGLGYDDTILVAESVPALPGFPPNETKAAFCTAVGPPHHFRGSRPVEDTPERESPPAGCRD